MTGDVPYKVIKEQIVGDKHYAVGNIVYPTGVFRDQLRFMGIIAKCEDAPQVETADLDAKKLETASAPPKRKRGRPRKAKA
jgi:hypothetical protein